MKAIAENQTKKDYKELDVVYRTYEIDEQIHTILSHLRGGYGVTSFLLEEKNIEPELAKKFQERGIEIGQVIDGLFRKTFEELDALIPVYSKELKELRAVRAKFNI